MAENDTKSSRSLEAWENEVIDPHRWGRWGKNKEGAEKELVRLKELWNAIPAESQPNRNLINQIVSLEICNWNLEKSILTLCEAIGKNEPAKTEIGHMASVSEERWQKVWAYYLALKNWLPCRGSSGYGALLKVCDPDKTIQEHISKLLSNRNELKELYVERFCLCLEKWLGGAMMPKALFFKGHSAAIDKIEEEIKKQDSKGRILNAMSQDGDGRLQPCGHKAFRRYDIIISSIGSGKWRGAMPRRGDGPVERITILNRFLSPIESWIEGRNRSKEELSNKIHSLLGESDNTKVFLASLLVSLLRSQHGFYQEALLWKR
jgi:hypothetical protein